MNTAAAPPSVTQLEPDWRIPLPPVCQKPNATREIPYTETIRGQTFFHSELIPSS